MKLLFFFFTICVTFSFACGAAWSVPNTKATLCAKRKCVDFCLYNGNYMQPGNIISVKNECAKAYCGSDFSMVFFRLIFIEFQISIFKVHLFLF